MVYDIYDNELITEAKFIRDLLILQPYFNLYPVLYFVLYDPAKSIKFNCLLFVLITPFWIYFDSIWSVNTECDLELRSLYVVEPTCLDFDPF